MAEEDEDRFTIAVQTRSVEMDKDETGEERGDGAATEVGAGSGLRFRWRSS